MGEGTSLGRETKAKVVLASRLRTALERLNPALPREAITAAEDVGCELCRSLLPVVRESLDAMMGAKD